MTSSAHAVEDATLEQIALSRAEYEDARERLGRDPTPLELGMIGALWSEHCGYKHSRPLFRHFPVEAPHILTALGGENAGAVDIGDGWVVVMKIESHNHPSAIEPYQGAATGVGGIVRDIFAMGARPIALLDSLRFGPPSQRDSRRLLKHVVAGIGDYGNCLGIPNVGGEVAFGGSYAANPLVNAMCVGLARRGELVSARADGPGNALMLVGADTGRDGLHGATFASVELGDRSEERRPAVQVGNPFMEKLLMEACVELATDHPDWITGLQDLGAAGLTSSAVECAARAGTGVRIDVSRVPRREAGMTPYDVMLSESQERMLVVVKCGREDDVARHFERWELSATVVGQVTEDGIARVVDGDQEVASIDTALLTSPPTYESEGVRDPAAAAAADFDPGTLPDLSDATAALLALLAAPNIADKSWVTRQYDQQVLTNTVIVPGSDAGVLRIKGTQRAIALATDGNGRTTYLDPWTGGARAVAEAARNVACTGATPLALTDCLNFGNPERPPIAYQLAQAVRGIGAAARALGTTVISGNASLYNETNGIPVAPTPIIGMLGVIEDVDRIVRMPFRAEGDLVFLVGAAVPQDPATLGGGEYLAALQQLEAGPVAVDLPAEAALIRFLTTAAGRGLLRSAHDCSDGGLAVALAECAVAGGVGLDGASIDLGPRVDAALFGEAGARAVVGVHPRDRSACGALAQEIGIPITFLGTVSGDRLRIGAAVDLHITDIGTAYRKALPTLMGDGQPAGR
ncbi:MAG: phosphoribosylformylglycinamidine synthase subunit PurL [Chloroflexi bacterium]|nr:phosphoribosylformylglycinamidine synthase subunit PurL [Chloroflexota bacterium]